MGEDSVGRRVDVVDSARKREQAGKVRERVWGTILRRIFGITRGVAVVWGEVGAEGSDEDDGEGEDHEEEQGGGGGVISVGKVTRTV